MTCPKCASTHTMTTERIEGITITWIISWDSGTQEEKKSKKVTGKCLDCGHEWRAEE